MDKYLKIVNKKEHFDYSMLADLNIISFEDKDGSTFIDKTALEAYKKLAESVKSKRNIELSANYTGRSVEHQQTVFQEMKEEKGLKYANKYVAKPGESEHHLGLAIDIGVYRENKQIEKLFKKVPLIGRIVKNRIRLAMYEEVEQDLADFGFILRYPKDKKKFTGYDFEPWHIRYVGIDHAKAIKESGMCLEEYVELLKTQEQQCEKSV